MTSARNIAVLTFAIIFLFAGQAVADGKIYSNGVRAINGYDPVAYFTQGEPIEGNEQFSVSWRGVDWWFADVGNRELFQSGPEKYAPQYGGYCAWAASWDPSHRPIRWRGQSSTKNSTSTTPNLCRSNGQ